MTSALTGPRLTEYYRKDSKSAMARRNAYIRLAESISGSRVAWRSLPKVQRQEVLDTARQMHDLGVDFASAERVEKTDKRGFVYVITNPAWPDHVKIGRAFNPESRLRGYQTSCPDRDYRLNYAVYFEDCYQAEHSMHYMLDKWRRGGEWFFADVEEATQLIDRLRETTHVG